MSTTQRNTEANFLDGSYMDIDPRGLREATCRKFGYKVNLAAGCQIAEYRDENGELIAQKVRRAGKAFSWTGSGNKAPLWGQHLFNPGKSIVITEGEIDAMAVSQAFNNKWPVVSLQNGAPSAVKSIERAYEWLVQFEKIVLCFDMDDKGREATQLVAAMLPAGKVYVMKMGYKDAGETLLKGGTEAVSKAFWNAAVWRPDGIVAGSEITRESLQADPVIGYNTPYPKLNELLGGIRKREITEVAAGTGSGKSTFVRELGYHLHQVHGLTIGNIFLEESIKKTAQGYVAIHNNVHLGDLRRDPKLITDERMDDTLASVIHDRMYFFDHFGSLDSDALLAKMRYLAVVLKCDFILLDHISIVISGNKSSSEGERRDIDVFMTSMRSLVESTGVGVIPIVHLNQPQGKSHEEGAMVSLNHLRGSGSLKHIPDCIIALERDQQGDNSNDAQIRVLKNREMSDLGPVDIVSYDRKTGRLVQSEVSRFANEEI